MLTSFDRAIRQWIAVRERGWTSSGTRRNYLIMVDAWIRILGHRRMRGIRPVDINALYLDRDDGRRSVAWLNKERDTLHAFFSWCIGLEIINSNPVTRASWPRRRGPGKRQFLFITTELLERILEVAPVRYHRLLVFLFLTALRIGEAFGARWRWVIADPRDSSAWVLSVPADERKQRSGHVVPLSHRALQVLGRRSADECRLFPEVGSIHSVRGMLHRVGRRLGIDHLSPHQFRRSCATRLANEGMSMPAIQRYIGWTSAPRSWLEMFQRSYYLGLDSAEVRGFQERLWPDDRS